MLMSITLAVTLGVIGILCYMGITLYLSAKKKTATKEQEANKEYNILEVRLSKHNQNHFKDIEELYQSLSTLYKKLSFSDELAGKTQPHISFEIVGNQGSIRFLIRAEKGAITNAITHYLKGRFKTVDVTVKEDDVFNVQEYAVAKAINLQLAKSDIIPLKSYRDYDDSGEGKFTDPLSSLMTSISTIQRGEMVWVQFVVTPENPKWMKTGEKIHSLKEAGAYKWAGKNQEKWILRSLHTPLWMKIVMFPFKLIGGTIKLLSGSQPAAGGEKKVDEELEAHLKTKKSKPILDVHARVFYGALKPELARPVLLSEIGQSFATFGLPTSNNVVAKEMKKTGESIKKIFANRSLSGGSLKLNTAEIALFWHPPTNRLTSPYINFLENAVSETSIEEEKEDKSTTDVAPEQAKELAKEYEEKPLEWQPLLVRGATCFGVTDSFGKKAPFIINDSDRRRHLYIIGQTGTGKSTIQQQMIISSIYKGQGCAVIDPHGELVEEILKHIPKFRKNDVALFDPSDTETPPAFNVLNVEPEHQEMLATEILGIFHRMFEGSWGPRLEQILFNSLMGVIQAPGATLLDIPAFITTRAFREEYLKHSRYPEVNYFWHDQFDILDPRKQQEFASSVLNKVEKFLNNKIVRGVFGAKRNRFNFDYIMNKQKILLVNLSKGKLTPVNSEIIGSMITSRLLVDAMKRVKIPEAERKDFFLFIDEFQNFVSSVKTFESILSEARKYRLNLSIAHQYLAQMPVELRAAIFGNVGTIISHRVGLEDAPVLVKQFGENDVSEELLTTLPPYTFYCRTVKNNKITGAIKVKHLMPMEDRFPPLTNEEMEDIISHSKKQYAWNEEDRKAYNDKEKLVASLKEKQKEMERNKKNKKKKGPLIGPSGTRTPIDGSGPQGPRQGPQGQGGPRQFTPRQQDHAGGGKQPHHPKQEGGHHHNKPHQPRDKKKFDPYIPTDSSKVIMPKKVYKPGPGEK